MTFAQLDNDLIVGVLSGDVAGEVKIPAHLTALPLPRLRFDGVDVIDGHDRQKFAIDADGLKRMPELADPEWPVMDCAFDDVLIADGDTWRLETDADRFVASQDAALRALTAAADQYREKIAGDISPLKAAELADKARTAERMINGEPVSDAAIAEAKAEMVSLGMATDEASADALQIAQVWKAKAGRLVEGRTTVNIIERNAKARIKAATTPSQLEAAIAASYADANAALAQFAKKHGLA